MNIVIFGPQGSGKGTQAKIIAKKFSIPHISTGDILRDHIKRKTLIGQQIEEMINQGNLVPDEMINEIVKERLGQDDCLSGFIFDGYPRNLVQAEFLDSVIKLDFALEIWLSDEEAIKRIGNRRSCQSCGNIFHLISHPPQKESICDDCGSDLSIREDDKEDAILKRLNIYHKLTEPLVSYFQTQKIYHKIDGSLSISDVSEIIFGVLK